MNYLLIDSKKIRDQSSWLDFQKEKAYDISIFYGLKPKENVVHFCHLRFQLDSQFMKKTMILLVKFSLNPEIKTKMIFQSIFPVWKTAWLFFDFRD